MAKGAVGQIPQSGAKALNEDGARFQRVQQDLQDHQKKSRLENDLVRRLYMVKLIKKFEQKGKQEGPSHQAWSHNLFG